MKRRTAKGPSCGQICHGVDKAQVEPVGEDLGVDAFDDAREEGIGELVARGAEHDADLTRVAAWTYLASRE